MRNFEVSGDHIFELLFFLDFISIEVDSFSCEFLLLTLPNATMSAWPV